MEDKIFELKIDMHRKDERNLTKYLILRFEKDKITDAITIRKQHPSTSLTDVPSTSIIVVAIIPILKIVLDFLKEYVNTKRISIEVEINGNKIMLEGNNPTKNIEIAKTLINELKKQSQLLSIDNASKDDHPKLYDPIEVAIKNTNNLSKVDETNTQYLMLGFPESEYGPFSETVDGFEIKWLQQLEFKRKLRLEKIKNISSNIDSWNNDKILLILIEY